MNKTAEDPQLESPASGVTRRWWVLLSLLLLLWSQFYLQLHGLEHLSDHHEETCQICLTGGSLDQVIPGAAVSAFTVLADVLAAPFTWSGYRIYNNHPYQPRAPPPYLHLA